MPSEFQVKGHHHDVVLAENDGFIDDVEVPQIQEVPHKTSAMKPLQTKPVAPKAYPTKPVPDLTEVEFPQQFQVKPINIMTVVP